MQRVDAERRVLRDGIRCWDRWGRGHSLGRQAERAVVRGNGLCVMDDGCRLIKSFVRGAHRNPGERPFAPRKLPATTGGGDPWFATTDTTRTDQPLISDTASLHSLYAVGTAEYPLYQQVTSSICVLCCYRLQCHLQLGNGSTTPNKSVFQPVSSVPNVNSLSSQATNPAVPIPYPFVLIPIIYRSRFRDLCHCHSLVLFALDVPCQHLYPPLGNST
jgi:hypothetical protein